MFLVHGSNGDVKLGTDGTPFIYWDNQWVPICGHFFWDNQEGAKLFCQKMGYMSGQFSGRGSWQKYSTDSFRIGKCNAGDEWESCSGGCNDYQKGSRCSNNRLAKCDKNQKVKITIKCFDPATTPSAPTSTPATAGTTSVPTSTVNILTTTHTVPIIS